MGELDALTKEYAAAHGLKPENIAFYAGSSEPLHYTTLAFTSPTKGLVMADPSYESPTAAAQISKAPVHKVPLTPAFSHNATTMAPPPPHPASTSTASP